MVLKSQTICDKLISFHKMLTLLLPSFCFFVVAAGLTLQRSGIAVPCPPMMSRCGSNSCIFDTWKCDRTIDCPDGSDEFHCEGSYQHPSGKAVVTGSSNVISGKCAPDEFSCMSDGQCIPWDYNCDSFVDCPDASDEANCDDEYGEKIQNNQTGTVGECAAGQFRCEKGGQCIAEELKCDLTSDCNDGSDELNCSIGSTSSSPEKESECEDNKTNYFEQMLQKLFSRESGNKGKNNFYSKIQSTKRRPTRAHQRPKRHKSP